MEGKRKTVAFLVGFVLFYVFLRVDLAFSQKKLVRVVGAYYKPFFFRCGDKKVRYCGLDIDILNVVEAFTDLKFEIHVTSFKEALDAVASGRADMAIGAIYVTPDRKKLFNFSLPYLKTGLVIVAPVTEHATNLKMLKGKRVCVKMGATGEDVARSLGKVYDWRIVVKKSTLSCFDAVVRGEADILLNDYYNSIFLISERYLGKLKILKDFFEHVLLEENEVAFPVRKGNEELLEKLNMVINGLKFLGKLDVMIAKWFPVELVERRKGNVFSVGLKAAVVSALLVLLLFVPFPFAMYIRQRRREFSLYRGLLEALPVAVIILSSDEEIIYCNDEAGKILSVMSIGEILSSSDEIKVNIEGKEVWYLKRIASMKLGNAKHKVISLQDITLRKLMEREREILNQHTKLETLGQITYQLAHDFNNVLFVLINTLSFAIDAIRSRRVDENTLSLLEKGYKECLKFSDFASRLIEFAKSPVRSPKPINLSEFLKNWKDAISRIVGKRIRLEIEINDTPDILASESALTQIILNLATNARDAVSEVADPLIKISCYCEDVSAEKARVYNVKPGRYVVLEVADNGIGIPDEIKDKIFDPFFTTKDKGSGIGLFTVHSLVRSMSGFIEFSSEVGAGTSFKVYLPAME